MQALSTESRRFFETAVSTYQQDLAADTAVQDYLKRRGFGPEAASTFRLGAVRCPMLGHEHLVGRLAIPYLTPAGVVNINFRCTQQHNCSTIDGHRKYLKVEGSSSNLFNVLDLKKPGDTICVAEGELDAITLSISGLPAVAVAGVNAWQDHFSRCLEDYSTVYSFADGDTAGSKFSKFLAKEVKARPIRMPGGMDCNDLYRRDGAEGLRKLTAG